MKLLDVMLAEYRSLETEIRQRTTNQFLILGGAVALTAAAIPAYRAIGQPTKSLLPMAAPLLTFFVTWLYFEQDIFITHVATYLHQDLRPRIQRQVVVGRDPDSFETVLSWEAYRGRVLFGRNKMLLWMMGLFRALFICAPTSALAVVTTIRFQWTSVDPYKHAMAVGLATAGWAGGVALLVLAAQVQSLYRRITSQPYRTLRTQG